MCPMHKDSFPYPETEQKTVHKVFTNARQYAFAPLFLHDHKAISGRLGNGRPETYRNLSESDYINKETNTPACR